MEGIRGTVETGAVSEPLPITPVLMTVKQENEEEQGDKQSDIVV
jgi:hypothetical protein